MSPELRDVTMQLDEGQDEKASAPSRNEVKSVVLEEALASFRCACDHEAGKGCWP